MWILAALGSRWDFLLGGGMIAVLVAVWQRVLALWGRVRGLVLMTQRADPPFAGVLLAYLHATQQPRKVQGLRWMQGNVFVRPLGRTQWVAFESHRESPARFRWRGRTLWYSCETLNVPHGRALIDGVFTYVRGFPWQAFLLEAMAWLNENARGPQRFALHRHVGSRTRMILLSEGVQKAPVLQFEPDDGNPLGWSWSELGPPHTADALATLSLRAELEAVVTRCRFWLTAQAWYRERGVPWREGFLFCGAPGTGKTSLVRAIAESLRIPLHVWSLATFDDQAFIEAWDKTARESAPCVMLFEDLDTIFRGRENLTGDDGVSFDTLLNMIDGAQRYEGLLCIATTNHPEAIDPALRRAGRLGREAVWFHPLDHDGRVKLARRIVGDVAAEAIAAEGSGDTAAEFQARCFTAAIAARDA